MQYSAPGMYILLSPYLKPVIFHEYEHTDGKYHPTIHCSMLLATLDTIQQEF